MTSFADALPVGTRVEWRREMYRVRFANRPIDHGVVVANDGVYLEVRPDHAPDTTVRGPAAYFSKEVAA